MKTSHRISFLLFVVVALLATFSTSVLAAGNMDNGSGSNTWDYTVGCYRYAGQDNWSWQNVGTYQKGNYNWSGWGTYSTTNVCSGQIVDTGNYSYRGHMQLRNGQTTTYNEHTKGSQLDHTYKYVFVGGTEGLKIQHYWMDGHKVY